MHWLPLTLICALALATADAVMKKSLGSRDTRELILARLTAPGVLLLPWVSYPALPGLPAEFWMLLALLLPAEIVAMLIYQRAIRDHPLSLTLPYLAFTPVLVTVTGWLVLGETVTPAGMVGILLVAAGAWLLQARAENGGTIWQQAWRPLAAMWSDSGSRQMLVVAAIYALTSVGSKRALVHLPPDQFAAVYFGLLGLLALLLFGVSRPSRLRIFREQPVAALAVGVLMAIMVVAHFAAIAKIEVAYMISVKRTSLLFGIAYGALLFGEEGLRRNLLAGSLMVGGVALIALG
jgi:drug/metabolite transporter (DMT)-like permease